MNVVREKMLEGMKPYGDFSMHKDLVAVTVGAEYYTYDHETDKDLVADFEEAVIVIEKDWLFSEMKRDNIANPLDFLQNEYTWDNSTVWFENAKEEGKIIAVNFN